MGKMQEKIKELREKKGKSVASLPGVKKEKYNEKNNVAEVKQPVPAVATEEKKERPQNKNLKPIQPGETRNPNGRPKGKLNFDTRIDMAIEVLANTYVKKYNKEHKKQITLDDVDIEGDIFLQYINKARSGDSKMMPDFMDRRHGKATQTIQVSGKDGNPIEYKMMVEAGAERLRKFQDKWFKKPVMAKK